MSQKLDEEFESKQHFMQMYENGDFTRPKKESDENDSRIEYENIHNGNFEGEGEGEGEYSRGDNTERSMQDLD